MIEIIMKYQRKKLKILMKKNIIKYKGNYNELI